LQTQYEERRTRYGVVRCYRSFVIGRYRCHRFIDPSVASPLALDGATLPSAASAVQGGGSWVSPIPSPPRFTAGAAADLRTIALGAASPRPAFDTVQVRLHSSVAITWKRAGPPPAFGCSSHASILALIFCPASASAIMASHQIPYFNGSSGSLTMFTAVRRASSRVSRFAADRRGGSSS
jgi:hypothetical protein